MIYGIAKRNRTEKRYPCDPSHSSHYNLIIWTLKTKRTHVYLVYNKWFNSHLQQKERYTVMQIININVLTCIVKSVECGLEQYYFFRDWSSDSSLFELLTDALSWDRFKNIPHRLKTGRKLHLWPLTDRSIKGQNHLLKTRHPDIY